MADNWGKTVGTIKLSEASEIRINVDAELKGSKFLVMTKWVTTERYSGPTSGAILVPMSQLANFQSIIQRAVRGV